MTPCIRTGSRLHFGLLNTVAPFGGIGVMVEEPVTEVKVTPSPQFTCPPYVLARVQPIAERIARLAGRTELPNCHVDVKQRAAPHFGLGSGTQLAMAVAESMCLYLGIEVSPHDLAVHVAQRGNRSAVGVHGYLTGGLIFESGRHETELNAIERRIELPSEWCVGIFRPSVNVPPVCGDLEQSQFADVSTARADQQLRELIEQQILPAAESRDFSDFASSVQAYNHASGMLFQSVQAGPYNGPAVTQLIQTLSECGATGIGQSSWGPGVFAWFESRLEAENFRSQLPNDVAVIAVTHPRNVPREAIL
jgi:beta-ribofuranosylaminobenzene 5'-phosphate synthase